MRADRYILGEMGEVIREPDLIKWAKWYENAKEKRVVAQDKVGEFFVSTVFLGLDHNFGFRGDGPPILWETMVFTDVEEDKEEAGEYFNRFTSKEDAKKWHDEVVNKLKEQI